MEKFWRENGTHGLPVVAYRTRNNLAPKVPTLLLYARQAHSWDDLDISGMVTEQGRMVRLGVRIQRNHPCISKQMYIKTYISIASLFITFFLAFVHFVSDIQHCLCL